MLLWVVVRLDECTGNDLLVLARNTTCHTLLGVLKLLLDELAFAWVSSYHVYTDEVSVYEVVWKVLDMLREASMVAYVA